MKIGNIHVSICVTFCHFHQNIIEANPRERIAMATLMKTEFAQYEPEVYPDEAWMSATTLLAVVVMVERTPSLEGLMEHIYDPTLAEPEF
jgi:hypothetical protein